MENSIFSFCTITTQSHLYKVFALAESLFNVNPATKLHVLLVDQTTSFEIPSSLGKGKLVVYSKKDLQTELAIAILKKYKNQLDKLRWSLKPVFMNYLLQTKNLNEVIYLDNDIAFFSDFSFLFDELKRHSLILTPHNYPRNSDRLQNWLEANFKVGLYNAGFVGANKLAESTLDWWAGACLYRCEKNAMRGLFDDQKYLDLVPIIDPNTLVLSHKGCNVAEWNRNICKRSLIGNEVLINKQFPIVFIHFNATTLNCFANGEDELLLPFFNTYTLLLKKYNAKFDLAKEFKSMGFLNQLKLVIWNSLNRINKT